MYTVVGSPRTRTMRVLWMLEELGQPYQIVPAKPHSDAVSAGNPGGKVPVLHDGDAVITDSVAICTYLADKHGDCTYPAGSPERGHQDAITQFCVDEIEGALWAAAKNTFINPEEHRAPAIVPVAKFEFAKALKTLEQHLDGKEFIAGDRFTVPDLLLTHCAGWARNAKFDIPAGPVADYVTRTRERPALQRAGARADEAVAAA
ncbi:MAG: glutathione S-transferase family protein [Pseudomonadota bacterium]